MEMMAMLLSLQMSSKSSSTWMAEGRRMGDFE